MKVIGACGCSWMDVFPTGPTGQGFYFIFLKLVDFITLCFECCLFTSWRPRWCLISFPSWVNGHCLVPSLRVWVHVGSGEKRACTATKSCTDKIQVLFCTAAFQRRVLTVQLLRLLLNFMDHKPHGNKESEQPCYYNSVKTGDIFHSFQTVSLPTCSISALMGCLKLWHLFNL